MSAMYGVIAYRSATCCRVWDVRHVKDQPITYGPYRTARYAKKIAASLRKDRVRTLERDNTILDHGPSFVKVKVVETDCPTPGKLQKWAEGHSTAA